MAVEKLKEYDLKRPGGRKKKKEGGGGGFVNIHELKYCSKLGHKVDKRIRSVCILLWSNFCERSHDCSVSHESDCEDCEFRLSTRPCCLLIRHGAAH